MIGNPLRTWGTSVWTYENKLKTGWEHKKKIIPSSQRWTLLPVCSVVSLSNWLPPLFWVSVFFLASFSLHWVHTIFHMYDPITLTQWSIDIWVHYAVTKQRKCALLEHSHPNMCMSWTLNIVWRKQWCTQQIIDHPLHFFHSLNSNFNRTNISCMISFNRALKWYTGL
jgi:hypothetical protein